jgi:alpha-tubulin suppressor-like RCC1 family protein
MSLPEKATQASTSGDHSCVLVESGDVYCWGAGDHGQLGNGDTAYYYSPVKASAVTAPMASIAATLHGTCGLSTAGSVICWGLPVPGSQDSTAPHTVTGLPDDLAEVAVGTEDVCARTANGALWCWGETMGTSTPTQVNGIPGAVTSVAGGASHLCAANGTGAVYCWGDNHAGAIGDVTLNNSSTPRQVAVLPSNAAHLSAGGASSGALLSSGQFYLWGLNDPYFGPN